MNEAFMHMKHLLCASDANECVQSHCSECTMEMKICIPLDLRSALNVAENFPQSIISSTRLFQKDLSPALSLLYIASKNNSSTFENCIASEMKYIISKWVMN